MVHALVGAPLAAAVLTGLGSRKWPNAWVEALTIGGMLIAFAAASGLAWCFLVQQHSPVHGIWYHWLSISGLDMTVGYGLDALSVMMCWVVTFISLLVHLYSKGYMQGEAGYARFFSCVSLFTFMMLMLVLADNGLQLFFGWEGVGVVSYLLIGFYYHKPSAAAGSLKAFLVNRVGDFGLVLGLATLYVGVGSLDFNGILSSVPHLLTQTHWGVPLATWAAAGLLVGAMGKSAQVPLHIWLPESMEGPTPISALIHAATMVTAGVYMLVRLSGLFEAAPAVLNVVLLLGSMGALLLGMVGLVQHDIKRVVAYSTLSQLGYMMAAAGASAYTAAMYHLLTHAFFKALLFLGAGSVIIAMHHVQDMREMGGLWRRLPVTYATFLVGSLALVAIPPFSGFFSKDSIIQAVELSQLPSAHFAHLALVLGAFVTALYSMRALMLTFHGACRASHPDHIHEPSWTMLVPLVILAVPSVLAGMLLAGPLVTHPHPWLMGIVAASPRVASVQLMLNDALVNLGRMVQEGLMQWPFWMSVAGMVVGWLAYGPFPQLATLAVERYTWLYRMLCAKWGFDAVHERLTLPFVNALSHRCSALSDAWIDRGMVLGSARMVRAWGWGLKHMQTGRLSHYLLSMMAGLIGLLLLSLIH